MDALQPPGVAGLTSAELATRLIAEFADGIDRTGVRPGIMGEIGTSSPVTDDEAKSLAACALVAQASGMAISVHMNAWRKEGLRVLDAGADISRAMIGHLNPSLPDVNYHREIAPRGAVVAYDPCGYEILLSPARFPPRDWGNSDEAVVQIG